MKTAISIPDELFKAGERLAESLGVSRSELYQRALAYFMEDQNDAAVTDAIDRVCESGDQGGLDRVLDAMQRATLDREDW